MEPAPRVGVGLPLTTRLHVRLLGPLRVSLGRGDLAFSYEKLRLLAVYLILERDRPHRRDTLAQLLWADQDDEHARHSLRQALTLLRRVLGGPSAVPWLTVTRETVTFESRSALDVDVERFESALTSCRQHPHREADRCAHCARQLEEALSLYRGAFLDGVEAVGGSRFEQWRLERREALADQAHQALGHLAGFFHAQGRDDRAVACLRRQLALDPCREDGCRQLMRLLVERGDRAGALGQFERCRRSLREEFGIEPEHETLRVHAMICRGELPPPARRPDVSRVTVWFPLPSPSTPFIGRRTECQQLARALGAGGTRLVTIVGTGGAGKTRLALEVAREEEGGGAAVCFVALQPARTESEAVSAIAAALNVSLRGVRDPAARLVAFLREAELLLVVDNVEQLLPAVTPLLNRLVEAAPRVRLCVTSREALGIGHEHVIAIEGLDRPTGEHPVRAEETSAGRLFVERARRAHPAFEIETADRPALARICTLVDGLPLALELAAGWTPVMSLQEIAAEIDRGMLATGTPSGGGMAAVFDHSWTLLDADARRVFARLGVFRGGATRVAVESVCGGSGRLPSSRILGAMASLVRKSLVRRTRQGRYELHDLVRQYAAARLAADASAERDARRRHAVHYLHFLAARTAWFKGSRHHDGLTDVAAEIANVRAALRAAIALRLPGRLAPAIDALFLFFAGTGHLRDGQVLIREVLDGLGPEFRRIPVLAAKLLRTEGACLLRLGVLDAGARRLLEASALLRGAGRRDELALALNLLGAIRHLQGRVGAERRAVRASLRLATEAGDDWLAAYSRNDLGMSLALEGRDVAATALVSESLAALRRLGDPRGTAMALANLGWLALEQNRPGDARRALEESLTLRRESRDDWGIAVSMTRLAELSVREGAFDRAEAQLDEALRAAHGTEALPAVLDVVTGFARLAAASGRREEGGALAAWLAAHAALPPLSRRSLSRILDDLMPTAAPIDPEDARRRVEAWVSRRLDSPAPGTCRVDASLT